MAERTGLEPELENALRWLATRKAQKPFGLLVHAIEDPDGDSAMQLGPLVAQTAFLPGTPQVRALAVWGLIVDTVNRIGPTKESRRRNALVAAFRLPRQPEITEPWRSTLKDRFDQLMALPGVFGDPRPTTTTPMHQAWTRALKGKLVPMLCERLATLAMDASAWEPYIEIGRATEAQLAEDRLDSSEPQDMAIGYRPPSKSAQPVFLDLFVTTVFMRRRAVYRRITERLVTARANHVDGYMARALVGDVYDLANVPVRALWGCEAVPLGSSRMGDPALTMLRFPTALQYGQKHHFVSETINEELTEERRWVNVEIDHHGIAPGRLLDGLLPISGLTIRIRFDQGQLPEACWWYAEQTERERGERPPDGDPRLLPIIGDGVSHTFVQKCHPRENYGISILWPRRVGTVKRSSQ